MRGPQTPLAVTALLRGYSSLFHITPIRFTGSSLEVEVLGAESENRLCVNSPRGGKQQKWEFSTV